MNDSRGWLLIKIERLAWFVVVIVLNVLVSKFEKSLIFKLALIRD